MDTTAEDDKLLFQSTMDALQGEVANGGVYLTLDPHLRMQYSRMIKEMADELHTKAASGAISWQQAASEAQEIRNTMMEMIRSRSTPVGRAMAQQLKREGKTLNELVARKTLQLYGNNASFNSLTVSAQDKVYSEIVLSAGKSNPRVNAKMLLYSRAGKGLILLSLAISVYVIATSDDKVAAAEREATTAGAGIAGGMAGGAIAGLMCGPGAPVCVTIGAFVGGALGAIGISLAWQ